jgi:hypothetical protein
MICLGESEKKTMSEDTTKPKENLETGDPVVDDHIRSLRDNIKRQKETIATFKKLHDENRVKAFMFEYQLDKAITLLKEIVDVSMQPSSSDKSADTRALVKRINLFLRDRKCPVFDDLITRNNKHLDI